MSEHGTGRDFVRYSSRGGRGPLTNFSGLLNDSEDGFWPQVILMGPMGMVNDRDKPMRDCAVFDSQTLQTSILRPELNTTHFEFKPMMFQMFQTVGQFGGSANEDPHSHLRQFL